jgi:hypothetical protein
VEHKGVAMSIYKLNISAPTLGSQADFMTTSYAQIRVGLLIRGTKDDI